MRIKTHTVERTSAHSHVSKLGFVYPVLIQQRAQFLHAASMVSQSVLGEPAREYHYAAWSGRIVIRGMYADWAIEQRRWYVGNRLWGRSTRNRADFWMVFRTERDRTLALMLL